MSKIPGGNNPFYGDLQALTRLRGQAKDGGQPSKETLRAAAQQFEALFTQMMLKSMRDTSLGDPLFDGEHTKFFREMHDQQLAVNMARGKGLGIADMLVRQLGGAQAEARFSPRNIAGLQPGGGTTAAQPVRSAMAASPAEFVAVVQPHAERAAQALGVSPQALTAQAALETGWGKSVVRRADGSTSYNVFGIKAGKGWQGERVAVPTVEYGADGKPHAEQAEFRAYGSLAEAFDDYVQFLKQDPRYRGALAQAGDARGFLEGLQRAGYATDPAYARKIAGIMDGAAMLGATAGLKLPDGGPLT